VRSRPLSNSIAATPLTARELGVAGLLLAVAAGGVFGAHVIHGGLYADDWSLGSIYTFPGHGGALSDFLNLAPARPVQALYLFATFAVLGLSAPAQLVMALVLGVLAATLFYAVLRALGVVRLYASAIAVLALLFPASDATKLWADASPGMLSVSFYCLGLLLAIGALHRSGRRALILHLASLAFYALSIMTYETTAPLIAVSAPLFCRWAPRRDVIRRTVADVVLVALVLRFVTAQTHNTVNASLTAMSRHAKAIFEQGLTVFSQSLFPFSSVPDRRLSLAIALAILGSGVAVLRLRGRADGNRELLGQALAMTAAGACVAVAGWAILIPAEIGYSPAAVGDGTRINDVAGFGIVVCVFGLLLTAGVVLFRGVPRSRTLAAVATSAAALVIGAGYTYRIAVDIGRWDTAQTIRSQVLGTLHHALPRPPGGALVYVTGYNEAPYPNIGSFEYAWDLNAAVKLTYDDPSLTARAVLAPSALRCAATALTARVGVAQLRRGPAAYGPAVYLLSYRPRYLRVVSSRRACLALGGS
jgi:hypothetical protein